MEIDTEDEGDYEATIDTTTLRKDASSSKRRHMRFPTSLELPLLQAVTVSGAHVATQGTM